MRESELKPTFRQLEWEGALLWSSGSVRCYLWHGEPWRCQALRKGVWTVDYATEEVRRNTDLQGPLPNK